jgi:hypothetical protein
MPARWPRPEGNVVASVRRFLSVGTVVLALALPGVWAARGSRVHAQGDRSASVVGAWTLNKDLSDAPQDSSSAPRDQSSSGSSGGRRRGGGRGGGGFGGGGGSPTSQDPERAARIRDAMRDIVNPPDHLTIVQTDTMVILTGPDGRTTRLSPDGKKVPDDSTKSDRRTKWDGGKLVSEISGLGSGKITETYSIDPERHQLHIDALVPPRTDLIHHVYDADSNR